MCNQELDSDVLIFCNFLNDQVAIRKLDRDSERYLNTLNRLLQPDLLVAPDYNVSFELGKNPDGELIWTTGPRFRRIVMEKGQYCFCWQRPPHSQLLNKARRALQQLVYVHRTMNISLQLRNYQRFSNRIYIGLLTISIS